MMLTALAISCYLPNATFSYNPLLHSGYLEATFIDESDDIQYQMCRELDGKIFRAEIDLALDSATADDSTVQPMALGDNYYFRVGRDIKIRLYVDQQDDYSAQMTTQSNFRLYFMETDAMIYYTLSFFAIQTYNTDECFYDTRLAIYRDAVGVETTMKACDLSFTTYAEKMLTSQLYNKDVYAEFVVKDLGSLRLDVGLIMRDFYRRQDRKVTVVIRCQEIELKSRPLCLRITDYLQRSTLYEITFKILFQVASNLQWVEFTQEITMFADQNFEGCLAGSYVLQSQFFVATYMISADPKCALTGYEHATIRGTIYTDAKYSSGTYYDFEVPLAVGPTTSSLLSFACNSYQDPDACKRSFAVFINAESLIFYLKINYEYQDKSVNFFAAQLKRADYCFANAQITLYSENDNPGNAALLVQLQASENQNCAMLVPMRRLLSVRLIYLAANRRSAQTSANQASGRVLKAEGAVALSGVDPQDLPMSLETECASQAPDAPRARRANTPANELARFSQRDDFSWANSSLHFSCEDCMDYMVKIGMLTRDGGVIGLLQIDDLTLYIANFVNRITVNAQAKYIGVALGGGAVFGCLGYLMNDFRVSDACTGLKRKKSKTQLPEAQESKSVAARGAAIVL